MDLLFINLSNHFLNFIRLPALWPPRKADSRSSPLAVLQNYFFLNVFLTTVLLSALCSCITGCSETHSCSSSAFIVHLVTHLGLPLTLVFFHLKCPQFFVVWFAPRFHHFSVKLYEERSLKPGLWWSVLHRCIRRWYKMTHNKQLFTNGVLLTIILCLLNIISSLSFQYLQLLMHYQGTICSCTK